MNEKSNAQICARFKAERERLGLTQQSAAAAGGVSPRTLQGYESGAFPPKTEFLAAVAQIGIDVGFVITGTRNSSQEHNQVNEDAQLVAPSPKTKNLSGPAPAPINDTDVVLVPIMSATGSMGSGNELVTEDVVLGDIPLSRRWLSMNIPGVRADALRLIHAYGDSMHGTLNSGDFAVVDTSCRTVEFPGVYLLHVNRLHFIKRVSFRMDGRLVVSSDNEAERTSEVLDGSHQLDVRGRVVYGWNGRRF